MKEMPKKVGVVFPLWLIALTIWVISIGCASKSLTGPVGKFQGSVNDSATIIGNYYRELNNFEREIYLDERSYDVALAVSTKKVNGKPTPILGQFSEESIQARLDALTLLGIYGERLADLAGSKAPEKFAQGATVLGENLTKLGERFREITGGNDKNAWQYSAPIGVIVGLVGQTFLELKRDAATIAAINQGAPAVRDILSLLERDFTDRINLLQQTGTRQMLGSAINYYNQNRQKMSFEERRQALNRIKVAAERYAQIQSANPLGLIQSLRESHEALVSYAKSKREAVDLERLNSALELFKNRVSAIANAVQKINELSKAS